MTRLIPTSQWVYCLFEVNYLDVEGGEVLHGPFYVCSSCDAHLEADVQGRWPGQHCQWATWEPVDGADDVGQPRVVGSLYGHPLYEDSWSHGEREAGKRGLCQVHA